MKKILCFLLVIVLAVSAVGCSFVGTRKTTMDNIQEQKGFTILSQETKEVSLTLPLGQLPSYENIASAEDSRLELEEIPVFTTDTTEVFLHTIGVSGHEPEGTEKDVLYLGFDIRHALTDAGTVYTVNRVMNASGSLTYSSVFSVTEDTLQEYSRGIRLMGNGPTDNFYLYIDAALYEALSGNVNVGITLNEISYERGSETVIYDDMVTSENINDDIALTTIYDIKPSLTIPCDELLSTMEQIETDEAFPADIYTIHVTGLSVPVKLYMRMDSVVAVEAHGHYVELRESRDIYGNCNFGLLEADGAIILEGGYYRIGDIYILTPEKYSEIHPGDDASYFLSIEDGRLRYQYTHNSIAGITQTGALSVAVSYDEFLYSAGDASIVNGEIVFAEPDESYVMSDKYNLDEEFERVWSSTYSSVEEIFAANRAAREEFAAERARREAFTTEAAAIEELRQVWNNNDLYVGYIESESSETIDICSKNGTVMSKIPREILAGFPAIDGTETGILRIPFYYGEYYNEDYSTFRWVIACSPTAMGSGTFNVCTSTDNGATWWVGEASRFEGSVTSARFVSENVGFISHQYWSDNGPNISRTIDGGKIWERMEIEIPEELSGYRMMPYTPRRDDDALLYPVVLYDDSGAVDEVHLMSYDGGLTWEWDQLSKNVVSGKMLEDYKNENPGDSFVYEGYTVEYDIPHPIYQGQTFSFHIHLPQINDDSINAEKWNAEILENYHQIFGEYLHKSANGTNFSFYADVTYNTVITENVVTIYIINSNGILNSGAVEFSYDIYHYDTVRKKFLTTNEFLAYYAEGQFADYSVADIVKFMNDNVFETDEVGNTYHLTQENIQGVIPSVFGDGKFDVVYQGFVMEGSHATRMLFSPYPTHSQMGVKNNVWADYTYRLHYYEYTNCRDREMYGQPAGYRLLISERSAGNYDAGYYVDCLFLEDIAEPPKGYTGDYYVPMETYNDGGMYMAIDHETDKGHLNIMIPFDKPDTAQDYYRGVLQKYFGYDRILCGNYQVNEDIAGLVAEVLDAYRSGKDPNELFPASKTEYTPYPLKTVRDNPNADEIGEILKNASVGESGIINFSIDLGEGWRMGLPMAIGGFGESWQAYFTGVYISKDGVGINTDADNAGQEGQMDLQELYWSVLEDKTMVYSLSAEQGMHLSELSQKHGDTYPIVEYSIIDLNRDGTSELVLSKSSGNYLILRVEENKVYAHSLPYRSFMELKEDGTFSWSGGASDWGIGRIDFNGYTCAYEKIAYCRFDYDNQTEIYSIESRNATEEDFDAYITAQDQKQNAVWHEYETVN